MSIIREKRETVLPKSGSFFSLFLLAQETYAQKVEAVGSDSVLPQQRQAGRCVFFLHEVHLNFLTQKLPFDL